MAIDSYKCFLLCLSAFALVSISLLGSDFMGGEKTADLCTKSMLKWLDRVYKEDRILSIGWEKP